MVKYNTFALLVLAAVQTPIISDKLESILGWQIANIIIIQDCSKNTF